ncbi:MAG: lipocalin family protein [Phycisphaerae bacterium]|nr:lipocalin family protein [Phycisphaerae bacterium]
MSQRSSALAHDEVRTHQRSSVCICGSAFLLRPWCGLLCLVALLVQVAGCTRALPPDIPEFKPPRSSVTELPEIVVASEGGEPAPVVAEAPKPAAPPEAPKPKAVATAPAEAPPPAVEEEKAEPTAATIVGTWRVTEMSHGGQPMPQMSEMQMTFTFAEDGTLAMKITHPQMPEPQSKSGTYSVSGNQLTITMEGESKTGPYTLDGNSLTIEIEQAKLVMTRT